MKSEKTDHLFKSDILRRNLAGKSVRGGVINFGSQWMQFCLRIVGTMVLARLLTPSDYGLIGMVAVIVTFVQMLKDSGLSMATVQKEEITPELLSTLFWTNVLLSGFLGLCVLAGSPLVAWLYGKPQLTGITAVLSISFILSGLSIQHQALLARNMRFKALAAIQIGSQIATMLVTITLAYFGWHYWALVAGALTTATVGTILTFGFCPWFPGGPRRGTGVRGMLLFGGNLTGFSFTNYFARNLDNALIGKVWGEYSLGLYSQAYNLLLLPIQLINGPISGVATPALCRLQNNPAEFRTYFCTALRISTFIAFPFIACLVLSSKEIVLLGFGRKWEAMIPIFQILIISGFAQIIGNLTGMIYVAMGMGKRMLQWGLMGSSWLVLSFFVGIPYGVKGVAIAYTAAMLLLIIPCIAYAIYPTPIKFSDVLHSIMLNLALAVISTAIAYYVKLQFLETRTIITNFLLSSSTLCGTYLSLEILSFGSLRKLRDTLKSFHSLFFSGVPQDDSA